MSAAMFEPPVRSSCWTAEAGLRRCVGFRVESPRGLAGYVEEVVLDDWDDVKALVVYDPDDDAEAVAAHGPAGRRDVPVGMVLWVDVAREVVRLKREP